MLTGDNSPSFLNDFITFGWNPAQMRYCLIRRADTNLTMMLKTLLLLQVLLHTVTAVVPTETKYGVSVVYCDALLFAMVFWFLTNTATFSIRYQIGLTWCTKHTVHSLHHCR